MRRLTEFAFACAIGWTSCLCPSAGATTRYEIPPDTEIVLQSGRCEMGCPVFRIVVFSNGDVIFQGRHHVRKAGLALTHIQPDQIREILNEFESIDYFHLENIYGLHGNGCSKTNPDEPIVITSLSMGGVSKIITHHRGCVGDVSKRLSSLEDDISKITRTAQWSKLAP